MPDVSFTNLLIVVAVAVLAPLTVGFAPKLRLPAVVLEIIGGIIIGPSVLGWVRADLPVQILALFGLAFLLFLSSSGGSTGAKVVVLVAFAGLIAVTALVVSGVSRSMRLGQVLVRLQDT